MVTVSYRTGPILHDCLVGLASQSEVTEIIVIDNGNSASEQSWLDHWATEPNAHLVRPGRNIGFAAACNLGARQATGDYVALVNPDLIVGPKVFAKVLTAFSDHPNAWLCGARLLNMDGSEQRGGRRDVLTPWRSLVELLRLDRLAPAHPYFRRLHLLDEQPVDGVMAVPIISGAFMVMERERFLAMGGMDETMFLHAEDVDFCLRVLLAGGQVIYCGDAPVHHQLSSSDVARAFVEWHKTRSTCQYFFKHFSGTYPRWSLFALSVALWGRFFLVALRHLPADLAKIYSRTRTMSRR